MSHDEVQLELRKIQASDKVRGLSLGDAEFLPLKIFMEKQAKAYAEQMLATTYCVFSDSKIIGYVSLVCGQIEVDAGAPAPDIGDASYRFNHFPAVKIARLAVDKAYRGSGLGRKLVDFSLGLARDTIASAAGCRFVVLDAKPKSIGFYEKSGFRLIDTEANRERPEPIMFLDLRGTPGNSDAVDASNAQK